MQIIFEKQTRFYGDLETVYFPIEVCTVTPKLSILTRALQRFCLIHEFVSFKLDHCNSLLYGLPAYVKNWTDYSHFKILRLELLLKPGNFIIFHWFCSLHWLPINGRIIFKILFLVYKRLNDQSPSCISELLTAVMTRLFLDHLHVGLLCRIILRLVRPTLHVNRMVIGLFPS